LSEDALWPRAASWLQPSHDDVDIAVFGVPAHLTSISPTGADQTPAAIRRALLRYSTYNWSHDVDLAQLVAGDLGDVDLPDSPEGEERTSSLANLAVSKSKLAVALGGDNSVTYAVTRGAFAGDLSRAGLITLDAHHDLRDGISNGSPVRRLIEDGLQGKNVVQIGIADFSNSPAYAARARELGITVIPRSALRGRSLADVWAEAVSIAGNATDGIHVDFDVDVCDRAVVPACPAATPGGISADELRQFAYLAGKSAAVRSMDITEIDATNDSSDERTVRLGALLILEAAAGLATR
jgi:formimidoylglutamase